ncbi:MAG TPA: VWA domain-containing protein [Pyrinomonadaceae bacterium]|nr:VWA domain-containing protein [Pyrinomonadaceae bacterium]
MSFRKTRRFLYVFAVALSALLAAVAVHAQTNPQTRPDDVIRVNTELVQTDVMVFDKKGRFVDQLTSDQFQLIVDKKPEPIAFFERVTSGPRRKDTQPEGSASMNPTAASRRGRTMLFFVDDLHLSPDSIVRTRKALTEFIDAGVAEHDQVAVTSASGQIGFLQQFTDDKVVLQTAVARLKYRGNSKVDTDGPPMTEYMASRIRDGDEAAIGYYVSEVMKQNCFTHSGEVVCMVNTQGARSLVIERARQIVVQSAPDTDNSLIQLEGLMRTAGQLPGRKLVFVISDGFYLNDRQYGSTERIKRITDAAGRAGVVIYTLDARGIISGEMDATNNRPSDPAGQLAGAAIGEVTSSQDGLNALARDTGGRPLRNTNLPMNQWIDQILDETANYYLLAWRPSDEKQKGSKFSHIAVSIKDRPDLVVRLRRGYFRTTPLPMLTIKPKHEKDPAKAAENDLRAVIDAPLAQGEVPTALSLEFLQVPGVGTKVVASLEINRAALTFDVSDGKQIAVVDIGGIIYDDKGNPKSSFVGRVRILGAAENSPEQNLPAIYRFQSWLPAGLYQVRVGLRDASSGKAGTAMQWIKIPALN